MKFSILNGNNVLGGENTTNESWQRFIDARKAYYAKVDELKSRGTPNDPLLGHPKPESMEQKQSCIKLSIQ